jgi:hypothetical protein
MSSFERYSATSVFGIPFNPEDLTVRGKLFELVDAYNIEPQELPTEATDITPYYWQNPSYRYFLSLKEKTGLAIVELMPMNDDSELKIYSPESTGVTPIRTIELPTQQETFLLTGGSPRFKDSLCIHEIVTHKP